MPDASSSQHNEEHSDGILDEARRMVAAGEARGIRLRLLGGLAVRLHAPSAAHRALERAYPDIDLVTDARRAAPVETLLEELGYTPDKQFNLLQGAERLLFHDPAHGRHIDVFVGTFDMCHKLPLAERLAVEPLTLPLAELLLTKLQIVHLNDKDIRDILALLLDHPLGESDHETINLPRVVALCAEDWGLWRTVTLNIDKVAVRIDTYELHTEARYTAQDRCATLRTALDAAPKSMRWKMRAAIGERVRWYTLPEEVDRS